MIDSIDVVDKHNDVIASLSCDEGDSFKLEKLSEYFKNCGRRFRTD